MNQPPVRYRVASQAGPVPPPNPAQMSREYFGDEIPRRENERTHYGKSLDLDRVDYALRNAARGFMEPLTDISRETVSLDGHLSALLGKRFERVCTADWELTPPPLDDPAEQKLAEEIADFTREQVRAIPQLAERVKDLAWGDFDGRAASELHWTRRMGVWAVRDISWIHARRLSFGPSRDLRVIDTAPHAGDFRDVGFPLEQVPYKFVFYKPRLFGDYPEREGLAPRALYWSLFGRLGTRWRMALMELFSMPWRIVKPAGVQVNDESAADAFDQAQRLGARTTARMPPGFDLEVVTAPANAGQIHKEAIEDARFVLSKLVLGATGTTDAVPTGLGSTIGDAHMSEEDLVIAGQARRVSEAFEDRVTDAIVIVNAGLWGLDASSAARFAPTFKLRVEPPPDRVKEGDRLDRAVRAGLSIAEQEAYERLGYRTPKPDEPVLRIVQRPPEFSGIAPPPRAEIVYPPGQAPAPGELPLDPQPVAALPGEGGPGAPPAAPGATPALPPASAPPAPEDDGPPASGGIPALEAAVDEEARLLREDCEALGLLWEPGEGHVCLAAQPGTVNGSPETLITRGVTAAARITGRWAGRVAGRVGGLSKGPEIFRAIDRALSGRDVDELARELYRRTLHGAMLGALDAAWEAEEDEAIKPPALSSRQLQDEFASRGSFAGKGFQAAVQFFEGKAPVPKALFDEMTDRARQRSFTIARLTSQKLLEDAKRELVRQLGAGADLRDFKRFVEQRLKSAGWKPASPSHVETIFRTNVVSGYSAGRFRQMTQPTVLAARPLWQVLTVNDGPPRQRPTHRALHNRVIRADDPGLSSAFPPFGYNCFLPTTRVRGEFLGASRAFYAGQAFELTTAKGRRLAVTANHPVLTARGMVRACELRKGDQLVGDLLEPGVPILGEGSQRHENHEPAQAQQVFGALAQQGHSSLSLYRGEDFHGEAVRFHGQIDVVGSYRPLQLGAQAAGAEQALELTFEASDALLGRLPRQGLEALRAAGDAAAKRGAPSGLALPFNRRTIASSPLHELSLGPTAQTHALLRQHTVEDVPRDAEFTRQLLQRGTGLVALDDLVEIRQFDWLGHVYDFATASGLIIAGGAIVSNCRCRIVSRRAVKPWADQVQQGLPGVPDPGFSSGTRGLI